MSLSLGFRVWVSGTEGCGYVDFTCFTCSGRRVDFCAGASLKFCGVAGRPWFLIALICDVGYVIYGAWPIDKAPIAMGAPIISFLGCAAGPRLIEAERQKIVFIRFSFALLAQFAKLQGFYLS